MTRLGRMPWRVNSRKCDDLNVVERVQGQGNSSEPDEVQYSSESRSIAPETNNSAGHVADPGDGNHNDLSSDDDGPEVEVADAARERVEQQVASEHAAKESRLAERRARAKARESAIAAQKKMRNASRSVENVPELSDDVFERAADAADIAAALDISRAKAIGLRKQSGTLRIPQKRVVVDGKEVVDVSSQRKSCSQADSGRDALKFLRKSMYGPNVKRVKAVNAIRKDKAVRNLRGMSRVGRRSKSISRE